MAIKIYRSTDRVKLEILDGKDAIIIEVAPLTKDQKSDISSTAAMQSGEQITNITQATAKLLKYSIKGIEGLEFADGSKYQLEFDKGMLKDHCVDELLNLEVSDVLIGSLYNFLSGVPTKLINQQTQEALENVRIIPGDASEKK